MGIFSISFERRSPGKAIMKSVIILQLLVHAMGIPVPETPAVMKIPKPGINLREGENLPSAVPSDSQMNIKDLKNVPKPVLVHPVNIEEIENSKQAVFKSSESTPLTAVEGKSEQISTAVENLSTKPQLKNIVDDVKVADDLEVTADYAEKEQVKFTPLEGSKIMQSGIDTLPAVPEIAISSEYEEPSEFSEISGQEVHVETVGVMDVDSSLPVNQLAKARPLMMSSPVISQIPSIEAQLSVPASINIETPLPVMQLTEARPLLKSSPVMPQIPIIDAQVGVPAPAVVAPVILAVEPEPLLAPEPPMPSVAIPFVGGKYRSQDEAGQYNFYHWGGPNTRVEVKDLSGVVSGSFAYINPDGDVQFRKYAAGPVHGFKVAASDLPVDTPEVAMVKKANEDLMDGIRAALAKAEEISA